MSEDKKMVHGEVIDVPIGNIEPNPWNPNEMDAETFNMLSENIEDVGFLQPILVVPLENGKYRIVDGEHRYEQQRLMDAEYVRCVVADPERFDEDTQKFQTLRMNKVKGSLNQKKFNDLVSQLMEQGDYSYDELAHNFGFVDEDEFTNLLDNARESLPTDEMKDEFDKAKDNIKTVDDLSMVLNRLFTEFGDTLPANFMILDFGGKQHVWVRMQQGQFKDIRTVARRVLGAGVSFDSLLCAALLSLDVEKFVEDNFDRLDPVAEVPHDGSIDDILGEDLDGD